MTDLERWLRESMGSPSPGDHLDSMVRMIVEPTNAARFMFNLGRKYEREHPNKPTACERCGKPVEPDRECYAVPTCHKCLAPPPLTEVIKR